MSTSPSSLKREREDDAVLYEASVESRSLEAEGKDTKKDEGNEHKITKLEEVPLPSPPKRRKVALPPLLYPKYPDDILKITKEAMGTTTEPTYRSYNRSKLSGAARISVPRHVYHFPGRLPLASSPSSSSPDQLSSTPHESLPHPSPYANLKDVLHPKLEWAGNDSMTLKERVSFGKGKEDPSLYIRLRNWMIYEYSLNPSHYLSVAHWSLPHPSTFSSLSSLAIISRCVRPFFLCVQIMSPSFFPSRSLSPQSCPSPWPD